MLAPDQAVGGDIPDESSLTERGEDGGGRRKTFVQDRLVSGQASTIIFARDKRRRRLRGDKAWPVESKAGCAPTLCKVHKYCGKHVSFSVRNKRGRTGITLAMATVAEDEMSQNVTVQPGRCYPNAL